MTVDTGDVQPRVQRVLDELVEAGHETGLQAAAYHRGELVADAAAGVTDPLSRTAVRTDTLFHGFSAGKGVTATLAHVLAEQGVIGYDVPVAAYWPEFAAHGKQDITLGQVLTHTAGVPHLPPDTLPAHMCDWDETCERIAGLAPLWEPGTEMGYHGWTFGWIIGEVVRRATGKPMSEALYEQVAHPLGVADSLFFGVPESQLPRMAVLEAGNWDAAIAAMPDTAPIFQASPRPVVACSGLGNDKEYLRADVPAAGTMSAAALARMYAALLDDVDGVRLISPERAAQVAALAFSGNDRMLGHHSAKTLGYFHGLTWAGGSATSFGNTGSGGSAAFADPAHGIAFALTKNRLTVGPADQAARSVAQEVYAALGCLA
ncbi:serine hydrolase domain-containing protein [Streptomyces sp. WMMC1477]|uniref:serine hydrolase domain-containing protein n=1 Tax=Streptomyces sp. WMMC1477 TaxID=3015155 RepID=UPI0022B61D0C|nr:serine hydrolase domain-containing protein [Streptomyces sp. WMMC1477]MCZ7431117.1 serine hydrolase [Streptomyces sp. WMMC1477]